MNFSEMLNMQVSLFLLTILGYYLRRSGMVDEKVKGFVSSFAMQFTIPASILKSFFAEPMDDMFARGMLVLLIGAAVPLGSILLGRLLYRAFPEDRRRVLQYATLSCNAGALGNAVAEGIFGSLGVLYASIYVIPQRVLMWSYGLSYFTKAPDGKTLVKKVLTHPCIVAVGVGLLVMLCRIPVPGFLVRTVNSVAGANSLMLMMLVGMILAEVDPKTMLERDVLYYSAIRLFLIPAIVFLGCFFLGLDHLASQVSVVLAGMPAASATVALASKYHRDEHFATKCVAFTTLLSMVTVPIWCLLLLRFLP